MTTSSLTRDPISLILPFLSFTEFATSAAAISRLWHSAVKSARARHDELLVVDYTLMEVASTNTSIMAKSTVLERFLQSPLRRHVDDLHVKLSSPEDLVISDSTKLRNHVPPARFNERVNSISEAMPHLRSLHIESTLNLDRTAEIQLNAKLKERMSAVSTTPEVATSEIPPLGSFVPGRGILVASKPAQQPTPTGSRKPSQFWSLELSFPSELRRLKFTLNIATHLSMASRSVARTWLLDLFQEVIQSPALQKSLRILECELSGACYDSGCVPSFQALSELRRLALTTHNGYFVEESFFDPIRAIPKLQELEGPEECNIAYLLREPNVQSFTRIGQSALRGMPGMPLDESLTVSGLLASSRDSLTELNAMVCVPPSFLFQLTRLRVLRVMIRDSRAPIEGDHGTVFQLTARISPEDAVASIKQCRLLERLHFEWLSISSEFAFTESHAEKMIVPLLNLNYLVLDGQHLIVNLDFFTRSIHLINGLNYFSFAGRLSSLDAYRAIYSLSQLRLLHIHTREIHIHPGSVWGSGNAGTINSTALDTMFRPRHQLESSWWGGFRFSAGGFPTFGATPTHAFGSSGGSGFAVDGGMSDAPTVPMAAGFGSTSAAQGGFAAPTAPAGGSSWSTLTASNNGSTSGFGFGTPTPAAIPAPTQAPVPTSTSIWGSLNSVVAPTTTVAAASPPSAVAASGGSVWGSLNSMQTAVPLTASPTPVTSTPVSIPESGQLPAEHLKHLRHFSQERQREKVQEWKDLANEAEKEHQEEIMKQEA